MRWRHTLAACLGLVTGVLAATAAEPRPRDAAERPPTALEILDRLPASVQGRVKEVLTRPTIIARGPVETFTCQPNVYHYFLENPERAVCVWRKLGAKVIDIENRGNGRYGWSDRRGSEVGWDTIYRDERQRVWYAEGKVKPGALLPMVPFQVVVLMRYTEGPEVTSRKTMKHQAEVVVRTDSRAAATVARMMGASAPRLAEQYVGQFEMFFSVVAWYLDQHPDKAEELLRSTTQP
jgi:hypothetical protein